MPQSNECQNCGCPEELYFYEHVLGGVTLCDACSWETPSKIRKLENPPKWSLVGKNWVPPNSKPCISGKQSEMDCRAK